MTPEFIDIPPAPEGDFNILHVSDSQYSIYLDSERGSRPIFEPVSEFARAIVEDYSNAQLERSTENDAGPGIFWVYGKLSKQDVTKLHVKEFAEAHQRQQRWFSNLVKKADNDWAQTRRHDHISELQRIAARRLKLTRDWLADEINTGNLNCPACGTIISPAYVVCPNCRLVLNEEKYKAMKFATA